jgi:hypothetical protein
MNHHASQAGAAAQPASAAEPAPHAAAVHEAHGRDLAELLDHVLAGDLASSDRVVVEGRIVRVLGALMWLQQHHRVNDHGHCPTCRSPQRAWWRPWPRRSTCTVHTALSLNLRQPDRLALAATAEVTS